MSSLDKGYRALRRKDMWNAWEDRAFHAFWWAVGLTVALVAYDLCFSIPTYYVLASMALIGAFGILYGAFGIAADVCQCDIEDLGYSEVELERLLA